MFRRAGQMALALALAGCTKEVVLDDLPSASVSDAAVGSRDASWWGFDGFCSQQYNRMNYTPRAAEVLILLDRSANMQSAFGNTTKQLAAQSALTNAVSSYQWRIAFGFEQFPADPAESQCPQGMCCAGPVSPEPRLGNASLMSTNIQCTDPRGSGCSVASTDSPSYAALAKARDDYNNRIKNDPTNDDDLYVLLVTSSEPSCAAETRDVCASARNAANDLGTLGTLGTNKVRIVVLSVGYQPDQGSCLSQISQRGSQDLPYGTQPLYSVKDSNDLSNTINGLFLAIAKKASCTMNSTIVPPTQDLSVYIGPESVPQTDGHNQDGWSYADPTGTSITFSGKFCNDWVNSTGQEPTVGYYCSLCPGPNACNAWP
jgi:hypothetical protein